MNNKMFMTVLSCLFAALISVGAYIAIPLPMTVVPIVLQNMFILIAALMLGPYWGTFSVALYLLVGIMGMPVFSGGKGGLVHILGPTGGYLLGYLPAVFAMGYISFFQGDEQGKSKILVRMIFAVFIGTVIIYLFGVTGLKMILNKDWYEALKIGCIPFLPGDAVKAVFAVILSYNLKPILYKFMVKESY